MNWSQLGTILWLRYRLTRNQWSRGGPVIAIIATISILFALATGAGCGIGGVLAGALALSRSSPRVILVVWDVIIGVFLFISMIGIVSEIQRSETIDISRLLHLPISQRDIFLVNYLASHLSMSIILFLPGMLGLSLGLTLGRSWTMICMFPLVIAFIFMITSWTYCLRGWLVSLMINKRRRRAVIAGITFAFIIIAQLPNLFNVLFIHNQHRPNITTQSTQSGSQMATPPGSSVEINLPPALLAAHKYVPFLWVGNGAMSLAQGNPWPAVLGSAGMFLIGGWGMSRAYRTTFRFYQGQTAGKSARQKPKAQKASAARSNFLEKQLPGIPQEAAALALAFFRSLMRAPEVKMALAINFFMMLFFGAMILFRRSTAIGENFKPFIAAGTVALLFFGLSQLVFNQFGFDRGGFRQLVLLPVPRKYILLGKNLAILPIAIGIGSILLVLVKFAMGISFVITIAAGFQLMIAFLLLSMTGNLMSVLVPYRIASGSLKMTKVPAITVFLIMISHSLIPAVMIPIFLPSALGLLLSYTGWVSAAAANLVFSIVLLTILAPCYWLSLTGIGNLLQRREKKILLVVTQEIE
jgi:ABC-2 type transport system permease protein